MFSLFIVYNHNLSQLSFRLLLEKINLNSLRIEILRTSIELIVKLNKISIQFNDCLQLEPISLRQLNAFEVNEVNDPNNKSIELLFTLSAKMETIPMKRVISEASLPINFELMNDWIFCHSHQHKENNEENQHIQQNQLCENVRHESQNDIYDKVCDDFSKTIITPKDNCSSIISNFEQILFILSKKSSQFLFESQDKKFSLFIKPINSDLIVAHLKSELSPLLSPQNSNQILKLNFHNFTNVLYKVFKIDEKEESHKTQLRELCEYRLSFQVEWFQIELNLFNELIKTLISSTKTVLPKETRFHTDSHLFYGFIDM